MEAKLLKVRLSNGSRKRVDDLVEYMKAHIEEPRSEMRQKGYFWDSVFYEISDGAEFLYVVIKSEDFSAIMHNDDGLVSTPFRSVYDTFRAACWAMEPYVDMDYVCCFNSAMEFSA